MLLPRNTSSILALRTHVQQFTPLTDAEWQGLEPHLREMTLGRKQLFAEEGKRANLVGFVLQGSLRQFYTRDGDEKTTYFYFENNLVADYISCLTKQPGLLTLETLEETRLLVFNYDVLERLCGEFPAWNTFARKIAEYIAIGLEMRLVEHLMYSPEERYNLLIKSNKTRILERIPQQYIASYLGMTPVSLSRIRNRLARSA
ncbi:MAG: Crp/Fnr family transcriptional regulator [Candidatus Kapabacteria bacterium]|jgi:CRP-like cAMP-binding protein|nr:Crp/Fnr family transcriptional regulator [Candidatus Kapabacteria bacterium]